MNYTGQRLYSESDLLYYESRYYDPVLSYFVTGDTIAIDPTNPQTLNRYSYVLGNPLNHRDPTGHCGTDANHAGDLDCTIDSFDHMTANERIAWLTAFARHFGYGDTFNSITAVIEYFRDSHAINFDPGRSWTSQTDAGVLLAIQDGEVMQEGRTPAAFVGASGAGTTGAEIQLHDQAAMNWAAFFNAYHRNSGDWHSNNNELLRLYGQAEQGGETFGSTYADRARGIPNGVEGAVINAFIAAGNGARTAQINGDFGVIFVDQNDPRHREQVYALVMALEDVTLAAYSVYAVHRYN
jgi:RHS repeat-associated protein